MSSNEEPTYSDRCKSSAQPPSARQELALEHLSDLMPSKMSLTEFENHKADVWQAKSEEAARHNITDCLRKHDITAVDRAVAVDQVLRVTRKFKCSREVFFKTVAFLDLYHAMTEK